MDGSKFVYLFTDGQFGCLHLWTIVDSAAANKLGGDLLFFETKYQHTMTNLDNILKCKDITFLTKVHLVKAIVFPVAMYRCDSCTIKKAEGQRIDAFELWC